MAEARLHARHEHFQALCCCCGNHLPRYSLFLGKCNEITGHVTHVIGPWDAVVTSLPQTVR